MKKKNLFAALVICLLALTTFSANAQKLSPAETDKLYKEAEDLEKTADDNMAMFILTQQGDLYDKAVVEYKKADSMYAIVLEKGTADGYMASVMGTLVEASRTLIDTKTMVVEKDYILKETAADRKKKVKYKGQAYKLSKTSKSYFEMVSNEKDRG